MPHYLHMALWPIALAELPDVDDIPIQYKYTGLNTFKVTKQLLRMTPIGSKVHIRDYYYINNSL